MEGTVLCIRLTRKMFEGTEDALNSIEIGDPSRMIKKLDKKFDYSKILASSGGASGAVDELKEEFARLKSEGFTKVIGYTNQYGYPRYAYALTDDEVLPEYLPDLVPRLQIWGPL